MQTREIERGRWNEFLGKLSNQCLNRPVTIEVINGPQSRVVLTDGAPLMGIAPEEKGSDACAVDIQVGKVGSTDAFLHEVLCASRVLVEEDDSGKVRALDIEGQEPGTSAPIKTIVTLH